MTSTITHASLSATAATSPSTAQRVAVFVYGVTCYAIGIAGLCWLMAATLDIVPFTGGALSLGSQGAMIALHLGMIALFGIQHAIMARPEFKQRWTKVIPAAAERPTFVLLAGGIMAMMMWLWQPMSASMWSVETPALEITLRTVQALGWGYMLAASFAINHFELFGLQQVYRFLLGRESKPVPFVQRLMYRFDRHPLMTGMIIGFWCTPHMRLDELVLAAGLSVYIVLGVAIEERDLVRAHGDAYRKYRRETRTIVPRITRG